jgi:CRP-like cAMP-binding protein
MGSGDNLDPAALLARTNLLGGLDPSALERLAEHAVERRYKKHQTVFLEGDIGDSVFVVVQGLVKIFVTSDQGEEMVLVTLRPPDTFGELPLIDGGPRSATAQTLEETRLLMLSRTHLLSVMQESPSFADGLLRALGSVVRRLTEQTADLVFLDLHGRVAKLLLALAEKEGASSEEGVVLDLQMTQTDLAAMVGGSRQSVNQILHQFAKRGYLELEGRRVILRDVDHLRHRAGL